MTKYIIITGGVVSSIGKGITSASIGRILRSYGLNVGAIKIDPYLNWDSGTLNPIEHGEVFVTYDGMESDLDLGHYERFLDVELPGVSNITTGKVYKTVIEKERNGEFSGACVQIIPHITDEIKSLIRKTAKVNNYDIILVELGGTVGDIESQPFLEALRQLRNEEGHDNVMSVHVTFVPYLNAAGEFKTKPTQHSTKELRSTGIHPDMIICRSQKSIDDGLKKKIAHFCDVDMGAVINASDASSIYEVPLVLDEQNVGEFIANRIKLDVDTESANLDQWENIVKSLQKQDSLVKIAIVGKYIELEDSYISVREALKHAAANIGLNLDIEYINSDLDKFDQKALANVHGIIIPGGFGEDGVFGKLQTVKYAIANDVPIFGICLGMHSMLIEIGRENGIEDANSSEFNENNTITPVIDLIKNQEKIKKMGGTMSLGSMDSKIIEDTIAYRAYKQDLATERHRHSYEFNPDFREKFGEYGVVVSGTSPDGSSVEIIELKDHPWFLGCQFHAEFKSRPNKAHPLFISFVDAAFKYSKK